MLRLVYLGLIISAVITTPLGAGTYEPSSACASLTRPAENIFLSTFVSDAAGEVDFDALRRRANEKPGLLPPQELHNVAVSLLIGQHGASLENQQKACHLLEEAARNGVTDSHALLGELLLMSASKPEQEAQAVHFYRSVANDDNLLARMRLAQLQAYGRGGLPADPDAAVQVIEQLARGGFAPAKFIRGSFFLHGIGGAPDGVQARSWFEAAAIDGIPMAEEALGDLLLYGAPGVAVDFKAALRWYALAWEHGRPDGALGAGRVHNSGRNPNYDQSAALEWFEKAASARHPSGMADAARLLAFGDPPIKRDPARACRLAQDAANMGNRTGAYVYALLLEDGAGCPKDLQEAVRWLQRAVDLGQAEAMERLGTFLAYGVNVPKDVERGKDLIEEAAFAGRGVAFCTRGDLEIRLGGPNASRIALEWYEQGAALGLPQCKREMARQLIWGDPPPSIDRLRAVTLLAEIVDQDADAAGILGQLYAEGRLVARDDAKALPLLRRGAEAGLPIPQLYLGHFLMDGRGGLTADPAAAVTLYEKAAAADLPDGLSSLGAVLLTGRGVKQDVPRALAVLEKAAALGSSEALDQLARVYFYGQFGMTTNQEKAAAYAQRAADLGYAWGQRAAAVNHLYGLGVVKDEARAAAMFRLAADQGDASALNSLGYAYLVGALGLPKDVLLAERYLSAAARLGQPNALMSMAGLHADSKLESPDLASALAYVTLAVTRADHGLDADKVAQARHLRDALRGRLSPAEIERAEKLATELARGFEPTPGQSAAPQLN